jgi:ATP-dependent Clp protease ATP-binding subunit ClpA
LLRRPEFVNRVDEFIVFEPLIRSQIRDIVGLRATALVERVAAQHIRMLLGDSALDFLAAKVGCFLFCSVGDGRLRAPVAFAV